MTPETPPFQPLLNQLWTPIVAITAAWQGRDNGQIAVSAHGASIVPDRPRVLIQLYKRNLTHAMVRESAAFALHLMRANQLELIHRLGFVSGRDGAKLDGIASRRAANGSPVLDDCIGHLECNVINAMDGGDMTCFLADVAGGAMHDPAEAAVSQSLLWRDMRRQMPAAWQQEWDRKLTDELTYSRPRMDEIDRRPWNPHIRST